MSVVSDLLAKAGINDLSSALLNKVTFYTDYTDPVMYSPADIARAQTAEPDAGRGSTQPVNPWGALFKPTFVVESPVLGKPFVFAPYGAADPTAYQRNQTLLVWGPIGVAALIAGSFFFLGRATKR